MSAFDDQMCTEMNKVPKDCLERTYWRRKLPPAFRYFLEIMSRELLLSSPRNTFAHSAGFFEELLIQRDMELSLLPYESYLGKLLKRKGLQQQHKPPPRAGGAAASRQPGSSLCMRCAHCGGMVCNQSGSPSPAPSLGKPGGPGPDFAIFGASQGQVGGAGPCPVHPPCKRCAHCHGLLTHEAVTPRPQVQSPSPAFAKGPDFAIFGSDYADTTPQGQAASSQCTQCGCQIGHGDMGRVSPSGAKMEEEFPKYNIITSAYERGQWGRTVNPCGRKKDDPEAELINARSLSFLMDY